MADQFYFGKRLSFDGQLCTVRFIGEVKGTKGEWLGVEWDDPTRGKHSGEHGGVKYFECASKHPTAGSFVRPTRKADPPRSFVEALKAKYASEGFGDPDVQVVFNLECKQKQNPLARQNKPIRISGKEVEEVGFDKIRKQLADLHELRIVILDGLCMTRPIASLKNRQKAAEDGAWPADLTDVKDACPKTIELDLSRNLFEEWREVASICEQLDKLKSLRVDGNRFRDTTVTNVERQRCVEAFANIKTLKLEETLLSWEELTYITSLFPNLTTFVASSNAYSSLSNHFLFPAITDLTLEDNDFHSLSDIRPLTKIPNLQRLVLKSNKIATITADDSPIPIFSSTLSELDLSYNEIVSWSFINQLEHSFPGLSSLRVSHNPLYNSLQAADGRALSAEDGYMLTVARLGNLKTLNHSPITVKERLNAESYYLSLIARELEFTPEKDKQKVLAGHPRWEWLCEEYGEPVIRRSEGNINPNSLAARLMRLRIYLSPKAKETMLPTEGSIEGDEATEGESKAATKEVVERFEVEVPMSFTAYSLLGIVGKRLGLKPMNCRLIWETGDWMPAARTGDVVDEDWDSDSTDGSEEQAGGDRVIREVEIVPGTRSVATWIDGKEAVVRVELKN
ncbi:hypothetical protein CC78DRAFT_560295 [Lojkania enalia]|uniref:CAP-Gly domain-containing protein n=1 Tax=Lojkania enalia TaxID=147567 RepID=A0A9P4KDM0_9PLEO|nr:hypothetical protein CC78DRAFT_560295 [Didymosphaeria enalia]